MKEQEQVQKIGDSAHYDSPYIVISLRGYVGL